MFGPAGQVQAQAAVQVNIAIRGLPSLIASAKAGNRWQVNVDNAGLANARTGEKTRAVLWTV